MRAPEPQEQRGLVTEVVVPVVQSAISGGVGAVVANQISRPKEPPQEK